MAAAPAIREAQLQDAIVELARLLGWLVYHTFDSRRSEAGFPDLCMVKAGRVVFAELKSDDGKPSPAQLTWGQALTAAGEEVYLWRPDDWRSGEVERVLRGR